MYTCNTDLLFFEATAAGGEGEEDESAEEEEEDSGGGMVTGRAELDGFDAVGDLKICVQLQCGIAG